LGITKSVGCLGSLIGAMPDRSSNIKATDIPCARLAGGNPSARRFFCGGVFFDTSFTIMLASCRDAAGRLCGIEGEVLQP